MHHALARLFLAALLAVTPACATLEQASGAPHTGPAVFGGARLHAREIAIAAGWLHLPPDALRCGPPLLPAVAPLDLPLSLAADALLLPLSAINEVARGGISVVFAE